MTWRWPWGYKEEDVPERSTTPELYKVRQLAQKAAELGAQVEHELAEHKTEGHQRDR